jgi:hypothetical protein
LVINIIIDMVKAGAATPGGKSRAAVCEII